MKNDRKSMAVLCLYLITMLFVFVIFVTNLNFDSDNIEVEVTDKFDETFVPDTQIVYVPIYVESTEEVDNSETVDTEDIYIVKSYEGKIGVFENNYLIDVIDVYTKTLPKADQKLLEKGIVISGKSDLNSLIEDYTG